MIIFEYHQPGTTAMPRLKLTAPHFFKAAIWLLVFCAPANIRAQYITTFGGDGTNLNNWVNNGTAAICNGITYPKGVCMDADNVYFTVSNAVRRISLNDGLIWTVAGSDTYGHAGDGGPGINAQFQSTYDVCKDAFNNLYVTEWGGHYIRKIAANSGVVTTIAGTGAGGYSGDGGPATAAMINRPQGIYCDAAGNIYFADTYNSRVRKITVATGIITTVAGNGTTSHSGDGGLAVNAGTPYPVDVSIDGAGNIYFIEVFSSNTCRVRKIQLATGIVTTVAGMSSYAHSGDGGPATSASLFDPTGLYVDGPGNIYISQYDDSRIRKVDVNTGIINTIAGTGINSFSGDGWKAINATMNRPLGLTMAPNGDIYVADNSNHRIRKISADMSVPPGVNSAMTITPFSSGSCPGSPVTFTYSAFLTGAQVTSTRKEWQVNGVTVSNVADVFTSSTLQNGDVVTCLIYYLICNNEYAVQSNAVTIVYSGLPPSVAITASKNPICPGDNATFTATPQNAGANTTYQWQLNGINAGFNSAMFTPASLADGDKISCSITTDPTSCSAGGTVSSNTITVVIVNAAAPTVSITSSANDLCPGTPVTFTATTQNAGTSPAFQWTINGQPAGSNSPVLVAGELADNDEILCKVTAPESSCANNVAVSIPIIMNIKQAAVIVLTPPDTLVNYGSQLQLSASLSPAGSSFHWTPAALLANPASLHPQTIPLTDDTVFELSAVSPDGCPDVKKVTVKIIIPLFMPSAFTPNDDGLNDVYRIPQGVQIALKDFSVYNRWGNRVFRTTDLSKGWDGKWKGIKQDSGVYVFIVSGKDVKGPVFLKGTFTLIR
jgi:gliding motility-associated-like protein